MFLCLHFDAHKLSDRNLCIVTEATIGKFEFCLYVAIYNQY